MQAPNIEEPELTPEQREYLDLEAKEMAGQLTEAGRARLEQLRNESPDISDFAGTVGQVRTLLKGEHGSFLEALVPPPLLKRAKEIDLMSPPEPTPVPSAEPAPNRFRRWVTTRPKVVAALTTTCSAAFVAAFVMLYNALSSATSIDGPTPKYEPWPKEALESVVWKANETHPLPPKEHEAGTVPQKVEVDPRKVLGDSGDLSEGQKLFAERVAAAGTRKQTVKIDGKDYEVPSSSTTKLAPTSITGYRLNGNQFETYRYESFVIARSIEETLFTVGGLDVTPGVLFPATPYLMTGEVDSWYRGKGKDVKMAAQRMTVYGCPRSAPADTKAQKLFEGDQMPTVKDPMSRESYEQSLAALRGQVGYAGMWNEITETAFGKAHLGLQTSLSVKGGWGNINASFDSDEHEEKGSVFMLLSQESFRVALDKTPPAAEWLDKSVTKDKVPAIDEPLMYVSEVIYGRAILVIVNSSLTSSDQKLALSGKAETTWATIEGSLRQQKMTQLATTTVKVLNWGGMAKPSESYSVEQFRQMLTDLKKSELKPENAVPIAFKARWLANHTPAVWVGVTPLRTYNVRRETVKFDMILEDYDVKNTHSKLVVFDRDGDLVVAANDSTGWNDQLAKKSGPKPSRGKGMHHPNVLFYDHAPVLGPEFTVLTRQGEHDGIRTWGDMETKHGDAFGEQPIRIKIEDLLKKPDRSERYTVEFPGPNRATFRVNIHAPKIPPLKELTPMQNPTAGTTSP